MSKLIKSLENVLAESYVLYLKTQNYHWNVTGPNFHSLHLMFENQYIDLANAIDLIAERIRSLGSKAPGNMKFYSEHASIKDGNENANSQDMVEQLMKDQDKIIKILKKALDDAEDAEDEVTASMMADRIEIHEKNRWMLQSSL